MAFKLWKVFLIMHCNICEFSDFQVEYDGNNNYSASKMLEAFKTTTPSSYLASMITNVVLDKIAQRKNMNLYKIFKIYLKLCKVFKF